MSLKSRYFEVPVLTGLIVWGLMSSVQGMGLSFFLYGPNQYRDDAFITGLYFSVIIAAIIGMFAARVAAFISSATAIILVITVLATSGLGHDSDTVKSLIWAIVWRPILAALFLFLLPPLGPVRRWLLRKRRNSVDH